jgi:hypothetical protein
MNCTRLESTPNSVWGHVVVSNHPSEFRFPYSLATGEVFNDDKHYLIRAKCAALVFITPLMTVIRTVYWFAKSIFMTLAKAYHYLDCESAPYSFKQILEVASDSIRAIGYGILMTGCALGGMIAPFTFRQHYGHLESALNRHKEGPHKDKFYLAICFQRLHTITPKAENLEDVAIKLTRYRSRVVAVQEAFWSCSYSRLIQEMGRFQRSV